MPISRKQKNVIGKNVRICLDCGSDMIDILEFAISCESCGALIMRNIGRKISGISRTSIVAIRRAKEIKWRLGGDIFG